MTGPSLCAMERESLERKISGALKSARDAHPQIDFAGFETSIVKRVAGAISASALMVQNPILELSAAVLSEYPAIKCKVNFASFPDDGPYGQTIWPEDGSVPIVEVAANITLEHVIEIMAHELAHVVTGVEAEHGPEWEAAFDRIHRAYAARMERET